jgi:alkylation response protein AidB-like acyl-CoA dehydrogenase
VVGAPGDTIVTVALSAPADIRAVLADGGWRLTGEMAHVPDVAAPAERHRAATIAQAFAADELYTVGASLIQVHGGIGFTWEHDAHLYYKRLLTLKELAGGSPGQLEELAGLILGGR